MSISADPLDFGFDLRAERRRRLRRRLRIAIPIVTLLALVAAIAGIGAYLYQANREDARVLTDDLLEELERRIVSEVEGFLEPASLMLHLAEEVLEDGALFQQRERLAEPLTMHILESNPQLANFNFADPQGSFIGTLRRLGFGLRASCPAAQRRHGLSRYGARPFQGWRSVRSGRARTPSLGALSARRAQRSAAGRAGRPGGRRGNGTRSAALPHVAERIRTGIRVRELISVRKELRRGDDVWRPRPLKFGGIGAC